MKILMKLVLSAVLLAGLLTGCAKPPSTETTDTSPPESTPAASDTEDAAWPRTHTDARGKEVTIEKKPERIAVTTWMITENLMALDTPPVAADTVEIMSEWASTKEYFVKYKVENLGASQEEINLEKLLEVQPDLILATTANEKIYDALEKIAPVIVFDAALLFDDWHSAIREVAQVVGAEEAAEAFIKSSDESIVQAREEFAGSEGTVAFLRIYGKTLSCLGTDQLALYYSADKGLGLPLPQGWPEDGGEVSLEGFVELAPEVIFVNASDPEAQSYLDGFAENSVWNSIPAVKEGRVYPFDLSGLTGGPLASKYGIQTVLDALAK
jgi:iron complex transport system substrate-binding protein